MNLPITDILQQRKFDASQDPGREPVVFTIENKNIGSLQNFIGITGLPKNGKGKFASGMIAAALSNSEIFGMRCRLPEDRKRIALWSTDESRFDLFKTVSLIKELSGESEINDRLDTYSVRRDDAKDIISMIAEYVKLSPDCSLLIIDNIADLLINYNDEGQSKRVINFLKQWTDIHNLLIVAVLHLGKGNSTTIGHLGAGLDRYAQSILRVQKDKDHGTYTMTGDMLRSAGDFSPIDITFDPAINTWKQTWHIDESEKKIKPLIARPAEMDKQDHWHKCIQIFNSKAVQSYEKLIENIRIIYGRGFQWAKECVTHLLGEGMIINGDDGFVIAPTGQAKLYIQ